MTKEEVRRRIIDIGIIPVILASTAERALMAVESVAAGGIPVVEVTMTVPNALDVIAELAKRSGNELLIGTDYQSANRMKRCRRRRQHNACRSFHAAAWLGSLIDPQLEDRQFLWG